MSHDIKDCESLWNSCLSELEKSIPKQSFETWLKPTRALSLDGSELTVQVPNAFFSEWVENHYLTDLKRILKTIAGKTVSVGFVIDNSKQTKMSNFPGVLTKPEKKKTASSSNGQQLLNPKYSFDNFVVGNSNQFAHAASLAVAEAPGNTAFNPLVIYSDVGLGKTHLVQAIGNFALKEGKAKNVLYISSEQFVNEFIESIRKSKSSEFSRHYRNTDILLIDDIQFLSGKEQTTEAFFHTFNTLHQNKKQIVLTSDRPPKQLKGIEDRLISRFQWGLVVDVQPPDLETRIAILKKKALVENISFPDEIFYFIATNIDSNIRELEGAFNKLSGYSYFTKQNITIDLAKQVLKDIITTKKKHISIEVVQRIVCDYLGIQEDKVRAKIRKKEIVNARHIAMYFSKQFTSSSVKTIGLHFGGRDHTTVIHALEKVEDKIKNDEQFRETTDKISQLISHAKD